MSLMRLPYRVHVLLGERMSASQHNVMHPLIMVVAFHIDPPSSHKKRHNRFKAPLAKQRVSGCDVDNMRFLVAACVSV